jgi:divalent metal cation (Fe/Co/Zn/Cd) transporter
MDAALPSNMIEEARRLASRTEGVRKIKNIKGRKMGIDIFLDMTIEVDKNISVEEAHLITARIRRDILRDMNGSKEILIHVEPFMSEREP